MKDARSITIETVRNGFIVMVGCWRLVFGSLEELMIELKKYLNNPDEVEKVYRSKYETCDDTCDCRVNECAGAATAPFPTARR